MCECVGVSIVSLVILGFHKPFLPLSVPHNHLNGMPDLYISGSQPSNAVTL